jgi:penicillin-binding protein 1A
MIVGFVLLVIGTGFGAFYGSKKLQEAQAKLPLIEKAKTSLLQNATVIVSDDGVTLLTAADENRKWVELKDIPKVVINATLAAEDKRFYEHAGVDYIGLARQVVTNTREGRIAGGASTLTMQLAKRIATGSEKTFQRKLDDIALAVQIERNYTKDYILEMYLNQVFYGSHAYGILKAAETYFNKPLSKLTAAEAAMLARCVRLPSEENPFRNLKKSIANRDTVLTIMREEKMISASEFESAKREQPKLGPKPTLSKAFGRKQHPYFVDYVLESLREMYPDVDFLAGGYRIETTLNSKMQDIAEAQVSKTVNRYRKSRVTTAAFLLTDREGRVRAMVGGADYNRNQYNMVTQGLRQPGSSFKPFVYALALERRAVRSGDSVSNEPLQFRTASGEWWEPKNSSGRYSGAVSLRSALANSLNVCAARVLLKYCDQVSPRSTEEGFQEFVSETQQVFGFTSKLQPVASISLGASEVSPLEMAQGYSVFMRSGERFRPFGIARIIGPDGNVFREFEPAIRRTLRAGSADEVDSFMRSVVTSGTATVANAVRNARGKTGTTSDNKDAWFVGYTDKLLGVGWIANETKEGKRWVYNPMGSRVYGGTHTAEMWTEIVRRCQRLINEKVSNRDDVSVGAEEGGEVIDPAVAPRRAQRDEMSPNDVVPPVPTNAEPDPDAEPQVDPDSGIRDPAAPEPRRAPRSRRPDTAEDPPASDRDRETPKEPTRETPGASEDDAGTVTVMVCMDTGRLANAGCAEVKALTFRKGRQPKSYCRKHGAGASLPPNPLLAYLAKRA